MTLDDLQIFAVEFRDGLIGTQPKASRGMCALVSLPLRAAYKSLCGVETNLVTEDGHTFLVTADGHYRIDPTIDQFRRDSGEKASIETQVGITQLDADLSSFPFHDLLEQFKRLHSLDRGSQPSAREAGAFVANHIYYPLARQGFFEGRLE